VNFNGVSTHATRTHVLRVAPRGRGAHSFSGSNLRNCSRARAGSANCRSEGICPAANVGRSGNAHGDVAALRNRPARQTGKTTSPAALCRAARTCHTQNPRINLNFARGEWQESGTCASSCAAFSATLCALGASTCTRDPVHLWPQPPPCRCARPGARARTEAPARGLST
jgi:hypothetical protein